MKKGQAEMMETFMVIIVLFLIIGMGMYFFFKFSISSVKEEAKDVCILDAAKMVASASSLSELRCSVSGHESTRVCVDMLKAIAAKKVNTTSFRSITCPRDITLEIIYREPDLNAKECDERSVTDASFPKNCANLSIYKVPKGLLTGKSESPILNPAFISIYIPTTDRYIVGRLKIGSYIVKQ